MIIINQINEKGAKVTSLCKKFKMNKYLEEIETYNDFLYKIGDTRYYSFSEFEIFYLSNTTTKDAFLLGMDFNKEYHCQNSIRNMYFKGSEFKEAYTIEEIIKNSELDVAYQKYKKAI